MSEQDHEPLTQCPCGGELRVIFQSERTVALDGREIYTDEETRLHCMDCDDWGEGRMPPSVQYKRAAATATAVRDRAAYRRLNQWEQ